MPSVPAVDPGSNCSALAIKAEVTEPAAEAFAFGEQKTMFGGNRIARGDEINEQDREHLGVSRGVPAPVPLAPPARGRAGIWR